MRRTALTALLAAAALAGCEGDDDEQAERTSTGAPAPTEAETPPAAGTGELARSPGGPQVQTVAEELESPWEIAFLPDGRAIVTERPGRVRMLERDLTLREEPIAEMETVEEIGEGGLLGAAVDPASPPTASCTSTGPPPSRTRWCATGSRGTAWPARP